MSELSAVYRTVSYSIVHSCRSAAKNLARAWNHTIACCAESRSIVMEFSRTVSRSKIAGKMYGACLSRVQFGYLATCAICLGPMQRCSHWIFSQKLWLNLKARQPWCSQVCPQLPTVVTSVIDFQDLPLHCQQFLLLLWFHLIFSMDQSLNGRCCWVFNPHVKIDYFPRRFSESLYFYLTLPNPAKYLWVPSSKTCEQSRVQGINAGDNVCMGLLFNCDSMKISQCLNRKHKEHWQ